MTLGAKKITLHRKKWQTFHEMRKDAWRTRYHATIELDCGVTLKTVALNPDTVAELLSLGVKFAEETTAA